MTVDAGSIGPNAISKTAEILEVDDEDPTAVIDVGQDEEIGIGPIVEAVGVESPLVIVEATPGNGHAILVENVDLEKANRGATLGQGLGLTDKVEVVAPLFGGHVIVPRPVERVLSCITKTSVSRHRKDATAATVLTGIDSSTGRKITARGLPLAVGIVLTAGYIGLIDNDFGPQATQIEGLLITGTVTPPATMWRTWCQIEADLLAIDQNIGFLKAVITRTHSNGFTRSGKNANGDVSFEPLTETQLLSALWHCVGGGRHEPHE